MNNLKYYGISIKESLLMIPIVASTKTEAISVLKKHTPHSEENIDKIVDGSTYVSANLLDLILSYGTGIFLDGEFIPENFRKEFLDSLGNDYV